MLLNRCLPLNSENISWDLRENVLEAYRHRERFLLCRRANIFNQVQSLGYRTRDVLFYYQDTKYSFQIISMSLSFFYPFTSMQVTSNTDDEFVYESHDWLFFSRCKKTIENYWYLYRHNIDLQELILYILFKYFFVCTISIRVGSVKSLICLTNFWLIFSIITCRI